MKSIRPIFCWPIVGVATCLSALASCAAVTTATHPGQLSAADSAAKAAIANERSLDVAAFPEQSVAVVPMNVSVRDTSLAVLGIGLADLLITDLARAKELVVVERMRLDAVMRELQLAATARVDSVAAPRVGKLLGARRVVVGDIVELPDGQLRLSARAANTQTSDVTPETQNTTSLNAVLDAEKVLVFGILQQMGVTLTPAERAQIEARPTRNISALLAYSRGVRADAQGDLSAAANYYRSAARIDPSFNLSKVRAADVEARASMVGSGAGADAGDRLSGIALLAGDVINRRAVSVPDAANAAFTNAVQKTATIIITVRVP